MGSLTPFPWKDKIIVGAGLAVLALCAVSAVFGRGGVVNLQRLQAEQVRAETQVFTLAQQNTRLREHLRKLESDDAYLEKLVRERLGWIKPGELVYRVDRRE